MTKLYLIFILILFISCNDNSVTEDRYVFNVGLIKPIEQHILKLNIINKDSIIDYNYKAKDSNKNFGFRYFLNKDILAGDGIFKYKKKDIVFKKLKFKIYGYSESGLVSHPRFILFRKDYGIIANIAYGAEFLFLNDKIVDKNHVQLFDKIIEKL